MVGLTAAIVLQQMVLMADPASYQEALKEAQVQQRPLLVLVGATWCPGCQTMKQRVLPGLARRGGLKEVSFAAVDWDADEATARQLLRGSSIPQLIAFSKQPDGQWHREHLVGETSEAEVQSLIARAIKAQAQAVEVATRAIGN